MSLLRPSASGTRQGFSALAAGLLSIFALTLTPGCSDSDGNEAGEFGGDMHVVFCSLGCTSGNGGEQVFCSIINTFQNQEISVTFSEPIDLFSVNSSSFRVVNVANGTSPVGQFFQDPTDDRRLIFRPALTFDENGNPVYGFESNTAYQIKIPGTAQGDDPPFITSTEGRQNQSRLDCTIVTTEGVVDPVPGLPKVEVFAGVENPGGPFEDPCPLHTQPTNLEYETITQEPLPELSNVSSDSDIVFRFDDIMNVATIVNPSTGIAPFIRVSFDTDGILATIEDRVTISGDYEFSVDLERLRTYLCFSPSLPIPSAGSNAALPRRVVTVIPPSVADLVGNPTLPENGGGTLAFVPVVIAAQDVTLPDGPEIFMFSSPDPNSNEDDSRSGASWGGGLLTNAQGGGSGRLGDLIVAAGEVLVLNTDNQTFPLGFDGINVIGNADPMSGEFPSTITITDGVFEFGTFLIKSGGTVRFEGINPARVYARGKFTVESGGLVDVSGVTPAAQESRDIYKPEEAAMMSVPMGMTFDEVFPLPPNAGRGGYGADRFDHTDNPQMRALSNTDQNSDAIENPGAITMGRPGTGVGRLASAGEGMGGIQFPAEMPTTPFTANPATPHGASSDILFDALFGDFRCRSAMVGAIGSGGAYSTDGGPGIPMSSVPMTEFPGESAPNSSNNPPETPGGDASDLGLAPPSPTNAGYVRRALNWQVGFLNGGAGGGGAGNHQYWTRASGYDPPNEFDCIGPQSIYREWHDHAGAQGGSGGGALHGVAGKTMRVDGRIDASGGAGGSARNSQVADDFGRYAMPGGGGSGGAIKLQAIVMQFGPGLGRLNITGGVGGTTFFDMSQGGLGGAGLIRLEDKNTGPQQISAASIAPSVLPMGPMDSVDFLSVVPNGWAVPRQRPGSMTASSSCWIQPDGNYFAITLKADAGDAVADQGWNMDVLWEPPGATMEISVPFRGFPNPVSDTVSFEEILDGPDGNLLGQDLQPGQSGSPIVVRFQGARVDGDVDNLCDMDVTDPLVPIVSGSLTPWVDHPSLLNTFPIQPNIVRYVIMFDGTTAGTTEPNPPGATLYTSINGITNLSLEATLE